MIKPSKLPIITAIFFSFTLLATGCINSMVRTSGYIGQACLEAADCAGGLSCVEQVCRRSGGGPPDAAGWDLGSEDLIDVVAATDAEDLDGSARDIEALDVVEPSDSVGQDAGAEDITSPDTGVDASCCAGGCAEGMVCSDCACEPVELEPCHEQDQLCDSREPNSSDYYCLGFAEGQPGNCYGKCDATEDESNATCPGSDELCNPWELPRGGDPTCRSTCTVEEGCDQPGFGCMPISHDDFEGVCLEIDGTQQIGESCRGSLRCGEGALCIDSICRSACNAYPEDGLSRCDEGHCVPITHRFGVCLPDTQQGQEGEVCSDDMLGRPCGSDALVCHRAYDDGPTPRCMRLCRIDRDADDDDCPVDESCTGYHAFFEQRRVKTCVPDSE